MLLLEPGMDSTQLKMAGLGVGEGWFSRELEHGSQEENEWMPDCQSAGGYPARE